MLNRSIMYESPSVPCNRAYCTAHHRFRNASFGENDHRTNSGGDGFWNRDRRRGRPSPCARVSRHPAGLHHVLPRCADLDGRTTRRTRRGVGDDRVDGADLIDGIEFGLVINGALIGPIDIGSEGGVGLLEMEMLGAHPIRPIDGCGSTYA